MKVSKVFLSIIFVILLIGGSLDGSPIKNSNLNVWTDYKGLGIENLENQEQTTKLQLVYSDLLDFVKEHQTHKVIVRALSPDKAPFFNPQNFSFERDDNFFYWAVQLKNHAEVEVVFDHAPFHLKGYSWKSWFVDSAADFFKVERDLGNFYNIYDKLAWVSIANEMLDPYFRLGTLISAIVIDPKELSEGLCQRIINILDQYRFNASNEYPPNRFSELRTAALLSLDQKDFAFANLAHFPLSHEIKGEQPGSTGIKIPEYFPGEGKELSTPKWRQQTNRPLLDTVYVNLADSRLMDTIFQNTEAFKDPIHENKAAVHQVVTNLGKNFRNEPFVKAPGYISNERGSSTIVGTYTYFRTGGGVRQQGQLVEGSKVEVRPPYVETTVVKIVAEPPSSNRSMRITSPFSTTEDLVEAEYYVTATPIRWDMPRVTKRLASNIEFVLSTNFDIAARECYLGNWHVKNFIAFLESFGKEPLFTLHDGKMFHSQKTFVLRDFVNIPNGDPYEMCNWNLGNQNH